MHVRRLTGALFASLVCVLLVVGVLIQPARGESQPMQPTLVIGMSGMSTSDIDFQSGAIANNLANAGFANALIRSTSVYTCRNEGWMSLVASGDIIDQAGRSSVSSLPDKCPSFSVTPLDSSSQSVTGAGAAHVSDFPTMIATVNWPDSKPFRRRHSGYWRRRRHRARRFLWARCPMDALLPRHYRRGVSGGTGRRRC